MKVLYRVLVAVYMAEIERKFHMSYKPDENGKSEISTGKDIRVVDNDFPIEEDVFEIEEPIGVSTEEKEPATKNNAKGFIYDLIFYAVLIFVCIYIIPNFVMQRTVVDGSSMENTLLDGDHLFVEKLSYRFDALDRFDIIVFYPLGRENEEYYVKRVIGLPGETVQIKGSDIYINGEILDEHYGKEPIEDPGRAVLPITLGEDEFFVMGDNRNVSKDSRYEEVGNVKKENIGGRVIFRIKPLSRFGTLE